MSTLDSITPQVPVTPASSVPLAAPGRPLHRLAEVRRRQGVTRRTMARRLHVDVTTIKRQEDPTTDLPLSTLYAWQQALEVPLAELLVETDEPLSAPVLKRARMVRLMKTAVAIRDRAQQPAIRRMAQMLVDQLLEIMPELQGISPWHAVGRRRSQNEVGQAALRRLPTDILRTLDE